MQSVRDLAQEGSKSKYYAKSIDGNRKTRSYYHRKNKWTIRNVRRRENSKTKRLIFELK